MSHHFEDFEIHLLCSFDLAIVIVGEEKKAETFNRVEDLKLSWGLPNVKDPLEGNNLSWWEVSFTNKWGKLEAFDPKTGAAVGTAGAILGHRKVGFNKFIEAKNSFKLKKNKAQTKILIYDPKRKWKLNLIYKLYLLGLDQIHEMRASGIELILIY
jgi:hypothetical protein